MPMHKVAGLYVDLKYKGATLKHQAPPYEIDNINIKSDMTISLSDEFVWQKQLENPHLTHNEVEYIFTGSAFYYGLVNYDGILLHSSAVMYKGEAYLFSAPSGTGKSTHTNLWLETFGREAQILNDDKPAIRITDDKVIAYGTPWSGKSDLNINIGVPIRAICFLERSAENWINRISSGEAIGLIMNQTVRPQEPSQMNKFLDTLEKILNGVPVFKLGCNISKEAAILAYNTMSNATV